MRPDSPCFGVGQEEQLVAGKSGRGLFRYYCQQRDRRCPEGQWPPHRAPVARTARPPEELPRLDRLPLNGLNTLAANRQIGWPGKRSVTFHQLGHSMRGRAAGEASAADE